MKKIKELETNVTYDDLYNTIEEAEKQIAEYEKEDLVENREVTYIVVDDSQETRKLNAKEIKNRAIESGVEEWFFDEISDECLSKYSVSDIIEMWNESQN